MDDGIPDRDTSKARQVGLEVAKVNFLAKEVVRFSPNGTMRRKVRVLRFFLSGR